MSLLEETIKAYEDKRRKWCVFNNAPCMRSACQLWDEEIEDCGLKRLTIVIKNESDKDVFIMVGEREPQTTGLLKSEAQRLSLDFLGGSPLERR